MTSKLHDWHLTEPGTPSRLLAATALRALARLLSWVARRLLARPRRAADQEPTVEFHAEAGAPEGALYVDGRLVGQVIGVNRL